MDVAQDVNAATALFESIGKTWNVEPELVRSRFFVWQPVCLEFATLVLSFISALLTPHPGRRWEEDAEEAPAAARTIQHEAPEQITAPRPRFATVSDAGIRQIVAMQQESPIDQDEEESANSAPVAKRATLLDYVSEIFSEWTPSTEKLIGKTTVSQRLGLGRLDTIRLHSDVRRSPHYRVEGRNLSFARFTGRGRPKTREAAIEQFIASIQTQTA